MIKFLVKNTFLIALVASSCVGLSSFLCAMDAADDANLEKRHSTPPRFEDLVRNTYGVHLTHVCPQNGLMIPGSLFSLKKTPQKHEEHSGEKTRKKEDASSSSSELLSLEERLQLAKVTPKYRFTLHWSLSGVAEDHDFSTETGEVFKLDRASYPFAILEPLKYLLPESYGGHDQDWITVGPHKLSSDSVLLVEVSHVKDAASFPGKIVLFNSAAQSLETSVIETLQKLNSFVLKRDIPISDYDVDITLENVEKMVDLDSPTLASFFKPTENKAQRIHKLKRRVKEERGQKWRITRYNEDNIPLTVNGDMCFNSPKEFYTSLVESGYFWGKHQFTYFAKFEGFLKAFFQRTIIFQAKQLFPEIMEGALMTGFKSSNDPIAYINGSIKDFRLFIKGTKLSETTQDAFNLWLTELGIWIKHVCEKDSWESPKFLENVLDPSEYLKRVVATVDKYSTQPMMSLYLK
ncbi:MAG: hypothetical protein HYX35_04950 [Proteobacteria bacterium]|nr:hypothetical protein [Pseudomonadota bacterium]